MATAKSSREFDYDPQQWAAIEDSVGRTLAEGERVWLRGAARVFLKHHERPAPRRAGQRAWSKVARLSDELRDAVAKALAHEHSSPDLKVAWPQSELTFRDALQVLHILHFGAYVRMPNYFRTPRAEYLRSILELWGEWGGEFKISRHPATGEVSGPLARYLKIVTTPVMGSDAPSPESFPRLIKRWRRNPEPGTPTAISEELYREVVECEPWPDIDSRVAAQARECR